jgi:hypothetical protein
MRTGVITLASPVQSRLTTPALVDRGWYVLWMEVAMTQASIPMQVTSTPKLAIRLMTAAGKP